MTHATRDQDITNSWEKEIKRNTLWKRITVKYIQYKHKNTGTSCNPIHLSGLQCFNSATECSKTPSLKSSCGLSIKLWSQFLWIVCFNWVCEEFSPALF